MILYTLLLSSNLSFPMSSRAKKKASCGKQLKPTYYNIIESYLGSK